MHAANRHRFRPRLQAENDWSFGALHSFRRRAAGAGRGPGVGGAATANGKTTMPNEGLGADLEDRYEEV